MVDSPNESGLPDPSNEKRSDKNALRAICGRNLLIWKKKTIDDFKKLFSEPKIAKNLLVQFSRACRDESIALKKFRKFENFLL